MITETDEVLARVKIALDMLPYVIDVPITDNEIVEVAEHAPPGPRLHSAFVAREFVLERQAWQPLGDRTAAETVLRPVAQIHGCQLRLSGDAFVFVKETKADTISLVGETAVVRRLPDDRERPTSR